MKVMTSADTRRLSNRRREEQGDGRAFPGLASELHLAVLGLAPVEAPTTISRCGFNAQRYSGGTVTNAMNNS